VVCSKLVISVHDKEYRTSINGRAISRRVQIRVVSVRAKQDMESLLKQLEREQRAGWFSEEISGELQKIPTVYLPLQC